MVDIQRSIIQINWQTMKQIDNYVLNSVIGNGQFGQVYKGKHL